MKSQVQTMLNYGSMRSTMSKTIAYEHLKSRGYASDIHFTFNGSIPTSFIPDIRHTKFSKDNFTVNRQEESQQDSVLNLSDLNGTYFTIMELVKCKCSLFFFSIEGINSIAHATQMLIANLFK